MRTIAFAKGHGARNDFVLFADPAGERDVSASEVAFVCDRRAGIGGDGVLRAVPARFIPEWSGDGDVWFMDYRNADGSIAEMCGNGLRVFLRFLAEEGLIDPSGPVPVGTRAGLRVGTFRPDGRIAVTMGPVTIGQDVTVGVKDRSWTAKAVDVGNPHAVALLPSGSLPEVDLTVAPRWEPASVFPQGVNVEFVEKLGVGHLRLRVHERGVGETEACGTGIVAAAALVGGAQRCTVEVRGGVLEVDLSGAEAVLIGPAVIVARGEVELPDDLGW